MKLYLIVEQIFFIVLMLCAICFLILLFYAKKGNKSKLLLSECAQKTRFAILIPARNESNVIESNLRSIIASDYPKELYDIFVIVESMDDPTVDIVKKYDNTEIFLREDLEGRRMKGYALDECIKSILKTGEDYDAFLILDADNLIDKSFLSLMSDAYRSGFDAACGKRDNKNWNSSVVSSSSALTFTVINTLQNKPKTDRGMNVMFSGTGFYVSYEVIKKLGGWPFASLTEDYEFSNYAVVNELKTCYVESAVYYDEQPDSLRQSIKQRTRWVRGFFHVKRKYKKDKRVYSKSKPDSADMRAMRYGTTPLLVLAIDVVLYLLATVVAFLVAVIDRSGNSAFYGKRILLTVLLVYAAISLFTVLLFRIEGGSINISKKNKFKTVLYHPFFLATYVISVVRALFVKDKWEVITHNGGSDGSI